MNFIVDIGNSFTKLAVFQEAQLVKKEQVPNMGLQNGISEFLLNFKEIVSAIVSNVSSEEVFLPEQFNERIKVVELGPRIPLPFKNKYATPETLGNDRRALVAAAAKHYPTQNVLTIDAGTCITYDFKNNQNEYLGGAISPGLEMRYKALKDYTGRLPLVNKSYRNSLIGNSTNSSITSGVQNGIIKEVDGFIDEYLAKYEKLVIIITGGDAQFLSINLKNTIFANSNFLLEGLNYILEFNNSQ